MNRLKAIPLTIGFISIIFSVFALPNENMLVRKNCIFRSLPCQLSIFDVNNLDNPKQFQQTIYKRSDQNENPVETRTGEYDEYQLTSESENQQHPAVSVDPDGIASIVWQDYRHGNWELYLCRIDSDMQMIVPATRITNTTASSTIPRIGTDSSGNTYIVWQEGGSIYYTKVSSTGSILVDPLSLGSGSNVSISTMADGTSGIAYETLNVTNYITYFEVRDSNGSRVGSKLNLYSVILPVTKYCAVGSYPGGDFYVYRKELIPYNYYHCLSRITPTASLVYNGQWFSSTSSSVERFFTMTDVTMVKAGYVDHYDNGSTNYYSIFDADTSISYNMDGDSRYPSSVRNPNNSDICLMWEVNKNNSGNYDLYGLFEYGGVSSVVELDSTGISTRFPAVGCFPNNKYCFAWQDNRNGNDDIYFAIIQPPGVIANFTAEPINGEAPLIVDFTDTSTGIPTSWLWDFGDGETSIEQNPSHTYLEAGHYTVSLIVANSSSTDTLIVEELISVSQTIPVTITDVSQRLDETKKVDIYYNVSFSCPVTIALDVSDDNGLTWNVSCSLTNGDIGGSIAPGSGKHIVWNILVEQPDLTDVTYKFKISASYEYAAGSDESDPFVVNTMQGGYSDYRIVPLTHVPNPGILDIAVGGCGFAWFALEGNYNGHWLPIASNNINVMDEQGNITTVSTQILQLPILQETMYMQSVSAFGIPIWYETIGTGNPGNQELITVFEVNEVVLPPENRQSILCRIVPYVYKADWGYRIFGYLGGGVTTGVVTGTGFFGGGSGSTIELEMAEGGALTNIDKIRIKRRSDMLEGVELGIGPPKLLNVASGSASITMSFPYEHVYEFDYDTMTSRDALVAFYLYHEPLFGIKKTKEWAFKFLSWAAEALLDVDINTELTGKRISDESGLDIEGKIEASIDLLNNLPLGLALKGGFNADAHAGSCIKVDAQGSEQTIYVNGQINAQAGLGPQLVGPNSSQIRSFYLGDYSGGLDIMPMIGGGLEMSLSHQNNNFRACRLTGFFELPSTAENWYQMPGQKQQKRFWAEITNEALYNQFRNFTILPNKIQDIGSTAVNAIIRNETFRQDYEDILSAIYSAQSADQNVSIPYGVDIYDKKDYSLDIKLEFPIPICPALVIKVGGGISSTKEAQYDVIRGQWAKGEPYLQSVMADLPSPSFSYFSMMNVIWDKFLNGQGNMWDVVLNKIQSYNPFGFIDRLLEIDRSYQIDLLNDNGSYIVTTENSMPAGVDSVSYSFWEWNDDAQRFRGSPEHKTEVIAYNKKIRSLREDVVGMHFGIGGFYQFNSNYETWNQPPSLTIKYLDSEITDIDENTLRMYREDSLGVWHLIPSTVVPDSNLVRADIPYFTTYTLAPSLPQGELTMTVQPDSLLADGVTMATVTSGLIYNNDGTIISDGRKFTVVLSRGDTNSADVDPNISGKQVASLGGSITFIVPADSIPSPISAYVSSVEGYAAGSIDIPLYRLTAPVAPILLSVSSEHRALNISWQPVNDPAIVGYKIYYDTDSGTPYNGVSNVYGDNSPVFAGDNSSCTISGLNNDQMYYLTVTAVDAYGNESIYSNELSAIPFLNAVNDLIISKNSYGISLCWTPSTGAESFKIYRSAVPYLPLSEMELVGQTVYNEWTDYSALVTEKYFYKVVAVGF